MFQLQSRKTKIAALLTGGVIMVATLGTTGAPAQAADKEKLYKGGAVALGVLGGYWALKGKTLPGVAAAAGAYYAYKKGQEENERDNDYNDRYNDRYDRRNNDYRSERYPDNYDYGRTSNRYPDYRDYGYGYNGITQGSNNNGSTIILK